MLSHRILARHVVKNTLLAMLGAAGVLVLLILLFGYFSELGDLGPNYSAVNALVYSLWGLPKSLNQILPIAALIGAVVGLGAMAVNSELVVMRASGVSLWRIVGWVMRPALLLVILSFTLMQWVMPWSQEQAQRVKYDSAASKLGEVRGHWVREGQRYIYINYANARGDIQDVRAYDLNTNYRIEHMFKAEQGHYTRQTNWQLNNVSSIDILSDGRAQKTDKPTYDLSMALEPKFVQLVTISPYDLSPGQLISYMRYLHKNSQVPKIYQLVLWQKLTTPLALFALVIIACSFVFGPLRQYPMGFRVVMALFVGLGFYYIQDFFGYASLVYSPSPGWFVLLPILLCFMVGAVLLQRVR